jgi:DDE family transposase
VASYPGVAEPITQLDTDVSQSPGDKGVQAPIQVVALKHFKRLIPLFRRLKDVGTQRDTAGNRELFMNDYCATVMLYLFNPLLDSIAMLQMAVKIPQVAKVLEVKPFSAGSFSESVRVFDPEQMKPIVAELAAELTPLSKDPRLSELKHALTLVDSTILQGLSRLARAGCESTRYSTSRDGRARHGWRVHMQLDLQFFCPRNFKTTGARKTGANSETSVLRQSLEPDRCYVDDGGYGDRGLFDAIVAIGSSYVTRMREDSVFAVLEEKLLSQEALDANVVRDAIVRLGNASDPEMNHTVRIIELKVTPHPRRTRKVQEGSNKSTRYTDRLLIASNLTDLPAELVSLIYSYRYSVELFFRFFKQLLGMRHLLSQREQGVEIQVYCCVIACLLISLQTGKKPNKLTVRMLGLYLMGVADEQDVINHLNQPDNKGVKLKAKAELFKKLGF